MLHFELLTGHSSLTANGLCACMYYMIYVFIHNHPFYSPLNFKNMKIPFPKTPYSELTYLQHS
ncbi:FOG: GAF domain [Solibacillus silvestris StLB046]|uniref:FOG: GAF domain n=1 Tax=Solibacillus silvestris (strain StLB046) TaxID=1002809 RepID=F2F1K3_SOLSS|nr:FOG: GAF domain [Solibacillus silvestris StLB046]